MAEKSKSNKLVVIVIILLVLILAAAGVVIVMLAKGGDDTSSPGFTFEYGIGFEGNAVVLTSGEAAVTQPDGLGITLQPVATSSDGINFSCKIGNPLSNKYDMYVALYEDFDSEDPIYLSGLFHPGEGLTTFNTNTKVPSGNYETILVITLVEEDHKTLVRQSNVFLNLVVS